MARAHAILLGLTRVDRGAYDGWNGENGCWGCELDVDNMVQILSPLGYDVQTLKTAEATQSNVLEALLRASSSISRDDILVFYFSGHGGQQPDKNADESDGRDETLCAYDGEILDDELNEIWPKFREGSRIVMISDSCNSGTNYRLLRDVPTRAATPVQPVDNSVNMRAQMIHLGGCRDGWTTAGNLTGGAFTQALCDVWDGGAFRGNYRRFLDTIRQRVSGQIAQYNEYGPVTSAFRGEKPFSVESTSSVGVIMPDFIGEEGESAYTLIKRASGALVGRRFSRRHGFRETPTAQGGLAKSSRVRAIAQQALAGKFSSEPGVRLGDAMYYLPTRQELQHLLSTSQTDRRTWLAERFDCDDFAYVLKAEASVHAYDSGDIRYGFCLGMIWGNFNWVNGYHAINWFIDSVGTLYLIEPQSDTIYTASHCENDVSLLLV